MLRDEVIDHRGDVVCANVRFAVRIHIFVADLAVLIQHQLAGEAITFHVFVIAQVIDGQHQRLLALGQHDVPVLHLPLLIGRSKVFWVDQHIVALMQLVENGREFFLGHHVVGVALRTVSVVKGPVRIDNQRVEEQVGYLVWLIPRRNLALLIFQAANHLVQLFGAVLLGELDRRVIVVSVSQPVDLGLDAVHACLFLLGLFNGSGIRGWC